MNFSDKTELMPLLNRLHDSLLNFKVIDDRQLAIFVHRMDGSDEKGSLSVTLKENLFASSTLYEFTNHNGVMKGKVIGKDVASNFENLNVELIAFLFTDSDLVIYCCDRTKKGLGNDKIIRLCEVASIEIGL